MAYFKNLLKTAKTKVAVVGSGLVVGSSNAFADVTFNSTTGAFEGAMDLGAYYSATEIAIGVLAITLAITLGIKMLKKSA